MKNRTRNSAICFIVMLFIGISDISSQTDTKTITIPSEIILDKIRGGMLGQLLGNINGLKYEMKFITEPGNVTNYIPSLPNGAYTDDDTDFEWIYIFEMQKKRTLSLPYDSIYTFWKQRINRRMWCSNRYVRHLMDMGINPPYTGFVALNPWAEFNISGQFLCETFGLIAPAMPQTAAKIALNFTRVAIDQEPAQNTQLFTAMISSAFVENDINKIIDAGSAALDPKSKTLLIINDIRKWVAQNPENWRETRRLLREKYTQENDKIRDKNGYELNTGSIIAALLYGKNDFQETMKMTFNFGWDADNTSATAGTIIGVMKGYKWFLSQDWQIVDRYRNETRDFMPMDETITSFCDRLISVFEMINENNGGKKFIQNNTEVYQIVLEQAKPVILLQSIDEQKQQVIAELEPTIVNHILKGNREEKSSAAYIAICCDLNEKLSKKFPKEWESAVYELTGYWKVINNVFYPHYGDDFKCLLTLRNKFLVAGVKAPNKKYTDDELYNDTTFWKEPGK